MGFLVVSIFPGTQTVGLSDHVLGVDLTFFIPYFLGYERTDIVKSLSAEGKGSPAVRLLTGY